MTEAELRIVFNVFIDSNVVTMEELYKARFSNASIQNLINKDVIAKLGPIFILKKTYYRKLFLYGIDLLKKNNCTKAKKVFDLCLKLKPYSNKVNYYIFVTNIKLEDYEEAIKYYKLKSQDMWTSEDYFILYMLSLIIDLPKEYISIITQFKDFYLNVDKDSDKGKYAEFKKLIFKFRFKMAENHVRSINDESVNKPLYLHLAIQAGNRLVNLHTIFSLINVNNLEIAKHLIKEYLIRLNKYEYYKLVKDLLNLSFNTDKNYEMVMDFLTSIESDERVKIDITNLTERFEDALQKGRNAEANHIFLILKMVNKLGISNVNLGYYSRRLVETHKN